MTILLLVIIYIAFISLGLPDSLFGVSWPVIHLEYGLDESFASLYAIIVSAGTTTVSFIAGPMIRKWGTGWVTAISVLLTAVGLLGIGLSTNVWLMIPSAIILGVGAGAVDTGLNDYVSKHYKPRHMSWLHCFWGIGVTVSPFVMSLFLENSTWHNGYTTISIVQFGLAGIMFLSLPLWAKISSKNKANVIEDKASIETKEEKFNVFKDKGALLAGISLALYCGMEYLVGIWGASFLVNVHTFTPALAAQYISLYYAGIMIGRFFVGLFTIKLSNKTLIRMGLAFALVGAIMLSIPVAELTLPALFFIGFGFAPIFPCTIDSTKSRFNPKYSADIIGFQMGCAYVGAFLIQFSVGFIATRTSFVIIPFVLLGLGVLLFINIEYINKITTKKITSIIK